MMFNRLWSATIVGLWLSFNAAMADNYYDDAAAANGDDAAGDDGGNKYYATDDDDRQASYSGDDFIKYWTEYAVLPQKCIHLNNKDVIVYSMYEKYYNHCADKALGTYMIDVPTFVQAYYDQLELNGADMYGDDYELPSSDYINCYPYETNNGVYYVQIGCTDGTSQSLSINLYKDSTCTTHDRNEDGFDDTTLDVSGLVPPFGQCTSCVHFVDKNEDDVDDGYFDNRMKNAPLCEGVWEYKQKCGGKCKRMGNVKKSGWNSSDKMLLSVLFFFSGIMSWFITKKRAKRSPKDALLEEAAMSAAGLEQTHVIGIFAVTLFIIALCGLAGFKGLTWTLLLVVNFSLFAYLMKLTIDSGMNVALGPDGEPIGADESSDEEDDDDDDDDDEEDAAYKAPIIESEKKELPPIS